MKKILFVTLTALLIFTSAGIYTFAFEDSVSKNTPSEAITEASDDTGSTEQGTSIFGEIYNEIANNSDKILAMLTFIGSLVIAFAYKKGLLPMLKSALNNMNSMISKLKAETERSILISEESEQTITKRLNSAEELILSLTESITRLVEELKSTGETKREAENAKIIMNAQVDMLYEIFMSSALPQYSKDRVGEKIAEMKALLIDSEG